MKRGPNDVAWSEIAQGFKCLWCGQPAIQVEPDHAQCINDPDCLVAHEAEQLEARVEADREKELRVLKLGNPV